LILLTCLLWSLEFPKKVHNPTPGASIKSIEEFEKFIKNAKRASKTHKKNLTPAGDQTGTTCMQSRLSVPEGFFCIFNVR